MKKTLPFLLSFFFCISLFSQFGSPVKISRNVDVFDRSRLPHAADYDGDGDLDIIVAGDSNRKVAFYENLDGLANYSDAQIIIEEETGSFSPHMSVCDLTGDNLPDIVTVQGNTISIYVNTNQPYILENPITLSPLGGVNITEIRDLDGDGKNDIICFVYNSQIGWYKGNDDVEGFQDFEILSDDFSTFSYTIVDYEADGDLDIVYGDVSTDDIMLLLNDGDENFDMVLSLGTQNENADYYAFGDFDSDGDLDLISSDYSGDVNLYRNLGDLSGFDAGEIISPEEEGNYSQPFIKDFDLDGDLDFLISIGTNIVRYENTDGTGNFSIKDTLWTCYRVPDSINEADLNNDGLQDLLIPNMGNTGGRGQLLLLLARTETEYYNGLDINSDLNYVTSLGAYDFDGNGKEELVIGSESYDVATWHAFDNSPYRLKPAHMFNTRSGALIDFKPADFDGDGNEDLLLLSEELFDRKVSWVKRIEGAIDFGAEQIILDDDSEIDAIAAHDFDLDGDIDIFFNIIEGGEMTNRGLHIASNDGSGNFSPPVKFSEGVAGVFLFNNIKAADIDADGDIDFVGVKVPEPGLVSFINAGDGTFTEVSDAIISVNDVEEFYIEDIDGDGTKDITCWTRTESQGGEHYVVSYLNDGVGNYSESETFLISTVSMSYFGLEDINGDDYPDVIVRTGINGVTSFYPKWNDGAGSFDSTGDLMPHMVGSDQFLFNDVDNDGDKDLIMEANQGALFLFENYLDKATIRGLVFFDENENGIKEEEEVGINYEEIELTPNALTSYTNSAGEYSFIVEDGEYEVSIQVPTNYEATTPTSINVELVDSEELTTEFGIFSSLDLLASEISITTGATRCGFEVPAWLEYENIGTVVGNGVVSLELDSLVSFISSSPAADSVVENTVYWSFENLYPFQTGQIYMGLQMPGVDFLGESVDFIADLNFSSVDGSQTYISGDYLEAIINCAYDPNDKQVQPSYSGYENYTLFSDTLDYTVRFQNTGTDTAFTVRIEDFLDDKLDWSSLRVIGGSHEFTTTLDQNSGRLLFTFEDILLPDSTTNEIGSQGYIRYTIEPDADLSEGTYIENTANILFDFNPPIITNTVYSVMVSDLPLEFSVQNVACYGENSGQISAVFPNPFITNYEWSTGDVGAVLDSLAAGEYELIITRIDGSQIDTSFIISEPASSLNIQDEEISNISCYGEEDGQIDVSIMGGGEAYNYSWNTGEETNSVNNLSAGTYSLTVVDENACFVTENYEITSPPEINITTTELIDIQCNDEMTGSISIEATGGIGEAFEFDWSNGTQTAINENLSAGTYTVSVTDETGCTQTEIFTLTEPESLTISSEITPATTGNADGSVTILISESGTYTYIWSHSAEVTGATASDLAAGDYTVTITDAEGCVTQLMLVVDNLSNLQDVDVETYFTVKPNPSSGDIFIDIKTSDLANARMRVYDILGRLVDEISISEYRDRQVKFSLKTGQYSIVFETDTVVSTRKVVVVE